MVIKLTVVSASILTHMFWTFMDLSLFQFHISCAYSRKSSRNKKALVATIFKLPGNKSLDCPQNKYKQTFFNLLTINQTSFYQDWLPATNRSFNHSPKCRKNMPTCLKELAPVNNAIQKQYTEQWKISNDRSRSEQGKNIKIISYTKINWMILTLKW
jgi:hypothetical protein